MKTDNFCYYFQTRLIQTSQTGGQRYNDTSPFSIPWTVSQIERERGMWNMVALFLFLKGMTGALSSFSYLVIIIIIRMMPFLKHSKQNWNFKNALLLKFRTNNGTKRIRRWLARETWVRENLKLVRSEFSTLSIFSFYVLKEFHTWLSLQICG